MVAIQHQNVVHASSCAIAESSRQAAEAAAIASGGGSAVVAAAVKAGEIAYYRSIITSAKANGLPYGNFLETLTRLGSAFAVLLLLSLSSLPAVAQSPRPFTGVQITATSGTVAAATATATLAAATGKVTYICGFAISSTGSTAAAVVAPTITGIITGTMTFAYASVAGATLGNPPLTVTFGECMPASAPNTAIVVSMPTLGAGNTNTTVNAWGYQR